MASGDITGRTSAGNANYDIRIVWNDNGGQNVETDVSTVAATAYLVPRNGGFDGYTCNGYLNINGVRVATDGGTKRWGWTTNGASYQFASGSTSVTHNADGSKSVVIEAYFDDGTNTTTFTPKNVLYTPTVTLTNFSRPPKAPATGPTVTRNAAGTTITVVSAPPASYTTATSATTRYDYRWNTDGGATWTVVSGTSSATFADITGLSATTAYYYQTRAANVDGDGEWSPTTLTIGAPDTITATRTGRNVAVTAGNAAGSGITGYYVQYSTDSGVSWSTAQAMTSQSYTYPLLTPALTYIFRVYATSGSGNSTYTTTPAGIFVPAGGKRWDGSAWVPTSIAKRWDGTQWVDITTAKRWDGSAWVDLS